MELNTCTLGPRIFCDPGHIVSGDGYFGVPSGTLNRVTGTIRGPFY
jgi:hypothetical protein